MSLGSSPEHDIDEGPPGDRLPVLLSPVAGLDLGDSEARHDDEGDDDEDGARNGGVADHRKAAVVEVGQSQRQCEQEHPAAQAVKLQSWMHFIANTSIPCIQSHPILHQSACNCGVADHHQAVVIDVRQSQRQHEEEPLLHMPTSQIHIGALHCCRSLSDCGRQGAIDTDRSTLQHILYHD